MFADLLRQIFSAFGLLIRHLRYRLEAGAFQSRAVSVRAAANGALGKKNPCTSRRTQDAAGELNQVLQEAIAGHQVVKAFGAENYESRRFRAAATAC